MFSKLLGDPNARKLKRFYDLLSDVNILDEEISNKSDDELRVRSSEMRNILSKVVSEKEKLNLLDDLLPRNKRKFKCLDYPCL